MAKLPRSKYLPQPIKDHGVMPVLYKATNGNGSAIALCRIILHLTQTEDWTSPIDLGEIAVTLDISRRAALDTVKLLKSLSLIDVTEESRYRLALPFRIRLLRNTRQVIPLSRVS